MAQAGAVLLLLSLMFMGAHSDTNPQQIHLSLTGNSKIAACIDRFALVPGVT